MDDGAHTSNNFKNLKYYENGKEGSIPADTVVLAQGMKAGTYEVQSLREAAGFIHVFEIGDCIRVAKVGEAVQKKVYYRNVDCPAKGPQ